MKNNMLTAGFVGYNGKVFSQTDCDRYNSHVAHINVLLHYQTEEDDSLAGQELSRAIDRRHLEFVAICYN